MKKIIPIFLLIFIIKSSKATDYFWVNGSGNWSDYGNHWANSSGGSVFHVQPPTPLDNVFFDANSFANGDTVHIDTTIINCKNMNWTGANNPRLTGTGTITIYGSLIVPTSVGWTATGYVIFQSSAPGNIVDLTGTSLNATSVSFSGTGDWSLLSDFNLNSHSSISIGSTFFMNGHTVSCMSFGIGAGGALYMGTSTVSCEDWYVNNSAHVDADSSIINSSDMFHSGRGVHYNIVNALDIYMGDSLEFNQLITQSIENVSSSIFHDVISRTIHGVTNSIFHNLTVQGAYGSIINSGSSAFKHVTVTSADFSMNTNTFFDSLIFASPGTTVSISDTMFISHYLQIDGTCGSLSEINGNPQGAISASSGSFVFNYLLLQNISVSGGAAFTANNSIDAGGVSGFNINSPAPLNLYWVGGTGSWNDINHWSTASGGAGGNCVPTPFDSVFFDSNSFSSAWDTVSLNGNSIYCKNMDWTGADSVRIIGSGAINIYGSLIVPSAVAWSATGYVIFQSSAPGNIVDLTGTSLNATSVGFSGTGDWSLLSDFNLNSNSSIGIGSTFFMNGHTVSCMSFGIGAGGVLYMGTSTVSCEDWYVNNSAHVDADSSIINSSDMFHSGRGVHYNIVNALDIYMGDSLEFNQLITQSIENVSSSVFHDVISRTIHGVTNSIFHNLTVQGAYGSIINSGSSAFDHVTVTSADFSMNTNTFFDTLIFASPGTTVSISDTMFISHYLQIDGTCGSLSEINGNPQGAISASSGSFVFNYLLLQNISVSGGAAFTANNSIDAGGVSGFNINSPAPLNLYWVGGTGSWNDINHWSTSSGGAGGNCVPTPFDSVFFDSNSFSSAWDTVTLNGNSIYCKNMDWTGADSVRLIGTGAINIYGSLIVPSAVAWAATGYVIFQSSASGNIVDLTGTSLNATSVSFSGAGDWSLLSDFNLNSNSSIGIGSTFFMNGHTVSCMSFGIGAGGVLYMGTSTVSCEDWYVNNSAHVDADSSIINSSDMFHSGRGVHYNIVNALDIYMGDSLEFNQLITQSIENVSSSIFHDVISRTIHGVTNSIFHNLTVQGAYGSIINSGSSAFGHVTVNSADFSMNTNNTIDSLILDNPGMIVNLSDTQNINSLFQINTNPGFPVSIAGPASINYNHNFCTDYIYLQNMTINGGTCYAGDHSVDLGGNTGWIFSSCAPVISNVWPGDANYDLIVDNFDLLYIGVAYGDTGYVRPGASNNFTAQPCQDWYFQFINGTNVKKADSDGNGIIDAADTTAVGLNYGLTHPFRLPSTQQTYHSGVDLSLQMPGGIALPGTVVNIPIMLGTSLINAANVYGIASTLNYDQLMIQPGSLSIDFTNSWIENSNSHLNIMRDFSSAGKCDAAFTRIDGIDVSGYGQIGMLSFKVAANAVGYLHFSFTKIKVISHNEVEIPIYSLIDSAFTSINEISNSQLNIFPNPSKGITKINFENSSNDGFNITLYDVQGRIVMNKITNDDFVILDKRNFSSGVYNVVIRSDRRFYQGRILFE